MVVWALIQEIGKQGFRERICRHNAMARFIAEQAHAHPRLEVLQEPTLSICCFRYTHSNVDDLNALNRRIHREMVHRNISIPSTAMINGQLAIRPCFVGARTNWQHAHELLDEIIHVSDELTQDLNGNGVRF